jgi:enterochelin esterase-like enzyme
VERLEGFASGVLGNTRDIDIYLPPGYGERAAAGERYPVLYANDGQDMGALGLKPTLERLLAEGTIPPVMVVAIPAYDRLQEYGTVAGPNADSMGTRAGLYARFVLEEVMPRVEASYRVRAGPEHTAIVGASLGGLSAFDLAWAHPDRFGIVGVFSGSFWWRSDDTSAAARQDSRIMHRVVRDTPGKPALRMWFEAGTRDETADRDGNGVIDAIQDTTELMDALAAKGYAVGEDMVYVQVEGGYHNQGTWAQALPGFLTWAFGQL